MDVFSFLISIHSHRWRRARCSDSHIGSSRWTVAAADCGGNHRPHSHRLDIPVLPSLTSSLPPSLTHTHAHNMHTHTHAHAHAHHLFLLIRKFHCVTPSLPPSSSQTFLSPSLSHTHMPYTQECVFTCRRYRRSGKMEVASAVLELRPHPMTHPQVAGAYDPPSDNLASKKSLYTSVMSMNCP